MDPLLTIRPKPAVSYSFSMGAESSPGGSTATSPAPSQKHRTGCGWQRPDPVPGDPCNGEPSRYALGPRTSLKHVQMVAVVFPGSPKGRCSDWRPRALAGPGRGQAVLVLAPRAVPTVWSPAPGHLHSASAAPAVARGDGAGGEGSTPFSSHSWHRCNFSDKPFCFCYCNYN